MQEDSTMVQRTCSKCGRPLAGDEPHGLCPSCLLQRAVLDETIDQPAGYCSKCRAALADDARFCAQCGTAAPASPQSAEDPLRSALEAKLGGQYRILRLLGRGGMGAVYLARDLTLEREVAIKVVTPASDTPVMYDRFRREAKTAAKLSHPNIVPLHAFGEVDGMPYFVMGYVRGESLAERMRREGRLPEEEVRRIIAEIADALDHAHRQGVVHRDVKPDNVLLEDASGRALLTDFGIARPMNHSESLTQHGSVVGTPHYMSPEQAAGHADIDGRSDIYSLGVMGYAMLAGRLPFEGSSAADILTRHLTQEPPSLRSLAPAASDSTLQAVGRCMAKDPSKRWQDGRALKVSLGVAEQHSLPDALESVHGQGIAFVSIAAVLLFLVWVVVIRMQNAPIEVLILIAATIVAGYGMVLLSLRFEGFPMSVSQRVIWSEPSWWAYWYPPSLRRNGNVWDRLPDFVRRNRSFEPLALLLLPLPLHLATPSGAQLFASGNFFGPWTLTMLAIGLVALGIINVLNLKTTRELKRLGIVSRNDRRRIASSAPPSRTAFWRQPHIEAILLPPRASEALGRSESPHDLLQAIVRDANELSGPLRSLGAEAASAARQLIASIEQSDRQIADLARNLEPGEKERLAEKIKALGEAAEPAPMRDLLQKQLELIRDLTARIEEAKENRSRHIEMLKTLALHLTSLRARLADRPSEVLPLSDSVRALCERISRGGTADRSGNVAPVSGGG